MTHLQPAVNPFALMMDPESILRAVESSERLARLKSHICRPLDKPLIPKIGAVHAAFDQAVDAEAEVDVEDHADL